MDSAHYINEKTHHIDELSMRPSEMDLVAILHNPVTLVPILAITLDKYSGKSITYIFLCIIEEEIGQ